MLERSIIRHHRFLLVLIPALTTSTLVAAEPRTWVDKSGVFSTEAELVGVTVELKTPAGRTLRVPLDRLRDEDRKYVIDSLTAEPEEVTPQPKAPGESAGEGMKSVLPDDESELDQEPVEIWGDMDEAGKQKALNRLPGARELHLFRVRDQQLAQLRQLKKLDQLEALTIAFSKVTDAGLANLSQLAHLRSLAIDSWQVTDEGLLSLAKLPKLETLRLVGTRVTPAAVERFRRLKPTCTVTSY